MQIARKGLLSSISSIHDYYLRESVKIMSEYLDSALTDGENVKAVVRTAHKDDENAGF